MKMRYNLIIIDIDINIEFVFSVKRNANNFSPNDTYLQDF